MRACRDGIEEQRRLDREAEETKNRCEAERAAALEAIERDATKRQVEAYQLLRQKMREEWAAEAARVAEAERVSRDRAVEAGRGKVVARENARLQKEAERRDGEAQLLQREAEKVRGKRDTDQKNAPLKFSFITCFTFLLIPYRWRR